MRSALALGRCAGEKDSLTSGVAGVQIPDKIPSAFVTQNLLSPGALLGSLGAMLDHRGRRVALSNLRVAFGDEISSERRAQIVVRGKRSIPQRSYFIFPLFTHQLFKYHCLRWPSLSK